MPHKLLQNARAGYLKSYSFDVPKPTEAPIEYLFDQHLEMDQLLTHELRALLGIKFDIVLVLKLVKADDVNNKSIQYFNSKNRAVLTADTIAGDLEDTIMEI